MRRSRRLISYSFDLVRLIAVTGLAILAVSFVQSRATVERLAGTIFREVSRQAVHRTRDRLQRAVPALDAVDGMMRAGVAKNDPEHLARVFLEMLRANPEFTWVSYGAADGSFTGAYRAVNGELRINRSRIVEWGATEVEEHAVEADGSWRRVLHDKEGKYDPRERPFYKLAVTHGRRVWTRPYVFYEGVPGITCALPRYSGEKLEGVLTIDFDLNSLSRFVSEVDLSRNATMFVFSTDGTVIAHPRVKVTRASKPGEDASLVTAADIDDPLVRAYFARATDSRAQVLDPETGDRSEQFEVRHGGDRYIATYSSFEVDTGVRWVVGALAPRSDFLGPVRRSGLVTLGVSFLALSAGVLAATRTARRIAKPMTEVAEEMERVGKLDLADRPLPESPVLEVAMMNRALGVMKKGLRSFSSYVPHDVVRAMMAAGEEAKVGGKLRDVTIFFSDIEGFSSIAEKTDPASLTSMLGEYLNELTRVIAASGGTVERYTGDGILAFWNAPLDDPKHGANACEAAIRCQRKLEEFRRNDRVEAIDTMLTRIGIATGTAFVGNIGTSERLNYTVMGDTANLAARLESLNKQYSTYTLVSEATYAAAKDRVVGRPIDVVAVKGKQHATRVYELLGFVAEKDPEMHRLARLSDEALAHYLAREFGKAEAALSEILRGRPDDGAARVLLERVRAYSVAPPPPEWNGVHVARAK